MRNMRTPRAKPEQVKGKPLNNRMFFYIIEGDEDMPVVNVYLSEDEYAQLLYKAMDKNTRVSLLVRRIVREWLKKTQKAG